MQFHELGVGYKRMIICCIFSFISIFGCLVLAEMVHWFFLIPTMFFVIVLGVLIHFSDFESIEDFTDEDARYF